MMKAEEIIAKVHETVEAPVEEVWDALVNPEKIKKYMFGTKVVTDWHEGSAIIWKGECQGKPYEDKGIVLQCIPKRRLQYSHFSPLSGLEDTLENYHVVKIKLKSRQGRTEISLSQDNNRSEEDRLHSEKNWSIMLSGLKQLVDEYHQKVMHQAHAE